MSISNEAVTQLIQTRLPEAQITVQGDGYKYQAEIVSASFQGLSKVKRHQLVYAAVNEAITSGQLHALTIVTYTPEEKAGS
ncbi:MAG: BolA/IbaG family iron-sulfur metabolism protein [Thiothrix sp.]|nr:MAG: BolA/IbaG family iron-sulfur metabolism protein [Thiothrix sp.]